MKRHEWAELIINELDKGSTVEWKQIMEICTEAGFKVSPGRSWLYIRDAVQILLEAKYFERDTSDLRVERYFVHV